MFFKGPDQVLQGYPPVSAARNAHLDGDLLVIACDGCDQSKFAVPRDPALKAAAPLPLGYKLGFPSCGCLSACVCGFLFLLAHTSISTKRGPICSDPA